MTLLLPELESYERLPACKGRVYRYQETCYTGTRGDINMVKRLLPQKRLSCTGCEKCWHIEEDIHEGISDDVHYLELTPGLKSGQLVRLVFVLDSTDWETGQVDGWHFRVAPL